MRWTCRRRCRAHQEAGYQTVPATLGDVTRLSAMTFLAIADLAVPLCARGTGPANVYYLDGQVACGLEHGVCD
jgi:hypothetical protein